jgi:hypothetical protein
MWRKSARSYNRCAAFTYLICFAWFGCMHVYQWEIGSPACRRLYSVGVILFVGLSFFLHQSSCSLLFIRRVVSKVATQRIQIQGGGSVHTLNWSQSQPRLTLLASTAKKNPQEEYNDFFVSIGAYAHFSLIILIMIKYTYQIYDYIVRCVKSVIHNVSTICQIIT